MILYRDYKIDLEIVDEWSRFKITKNGGERFYPRPGGTAHYEPTEIRARLWIDAREKEKESR